MLVSALAPTDRLFGILCLLQSSSDLPLLTFIRDTATQLLSSLLLVDSPLLSPSSAGPLHPAQPQPRARPSNFRIGFITPPFRDSRIPVTDHLHAHAFIAPADRLGWFRGVAYSAVAWYDIDDLIAEIRYVPAFFHRDVNMTTV